MFLEIWKVYCLIVTFFPYFVFSNIDSQNDVTTHTITLNGRVFAPDYCDPAKWHSETSVILKGSDHKAFLREDGTFTVFNVTTGSYILEVVNPVFMYENVRIEINSKGKIRARKVNYIQSSQVIQVPYPLKLKPLGQYRYFQIREQWRITDVLFNPMVIMMVFPLLLVMLLPKMMNDPDTRKEMEQMGNIKYDMPEMSEVITSFFSNGATASTSKVRPSIKSKKSKNT